MSPEEGSACLAMPGGGSARVRTPPRRAALGRLFLASIAFTLGACGDPDVQLPRPLTGESEIRYPLGPWNEGVEGEVRLRLLVDADGAIDSVEVLESSGRAELDSAAVTGARELRFEPARDEEGPVRVWAELPVRFSRPPGGNP